MSLHRESKRWFCQTCIQPEVIETPYILTPEQAEAITLRCQQCDAVFLSNFKVKLETDKSTYLCERCQGSLAFFRASSTATVSAHRSAFKTDRTS